MQHGLSAGAGLRRTGHDLICSPAASGSPNGRNELDRQLRGCLHRANDCGTARTSAAVGGYKRRTEDVGAMPALDPKSLGAKSPRAVGAVVAAREIQS